MPKDHRSEAARKYWTDQGRSKTLAFIKKLREANLARLESCDPCECLKWQGFALALKVIEHEAPLEVYDEKTGELKENGTVQKA